MRPFAGSTNIFSTGFDNPAGTGNTLGWLGSQTAANSFAATTTGGDSGGPLLFDNGGQWALMGVLSGGTAGTSIYGDISWWTGVAPCRSQIEAADGVFISVEPEAATDGLMLLGLEVIGARLRRAAQARATVGRRLRRSAAQPAPGQQAGQAHTQHQPTRGLGHGVGQERDRDALEGLRDRAAELDAVAEHRR